MLTCPKVPDSPWIQNPHWTVGEVQREHQILGLPSHQDENIGFYDRPHGALGQLASASSAVLKADSIKSIIQH